MFRHERPQSGRLRQHHQIGAEIILVDPGEEQEAEGEAEGGLVAGKANKVNLTSSCSTERGSGGRTEANLYRTPPDARHGHFDLDGETSVSAYSRGRHC